MALRTLTYISKSLCGTNYSGVLDIMRACDRRNVALGLTGRLFFNRQTFFQTLEGDAKAVADMFARIEADPRHAGVRVVIDAAIEMRRYDDFQVEPRTELDTTGGILPDGARAIRGLEWRTPHSMPPAVKTYRDASDEVGASGFRVRNYGGR